MLNKTLFIICAVILLGVGVTGYEYYFGNNGGTIDIEKTYSSTLLTQIQSAYPEIRSISTVGTLTRIECGSLSEFQCRRMADKIEEIVTKLCLDRNGIISVEVNAQGNIVRTVGDTSCLR